MDRILLFIPVYNCEKQIERVLEKIIKADISYITEIIIINNRSNDETEDVVRNYIASSKLPLTLFRNDENYNLGGSHKVAFDYAIENEFNYVIVLHGDDQGDINDIVPIIRSGIHRDYDCCLGSRFMKKSKLPGYSKIRIFGNMVFNGLFSLITLSSIKDLGSGLNIYKVSMLKSRFYLKYPDYLTFNCYMLLANKVFEFRSLFFPISWREEDQVSNVRLFRQTITTLGIVVEYLFSNKEKYMSKEFRVHPKIKYSAQMISSNRRDVSESI